MRDELIGLQVQVDYCDLDICGKVVDETKNTLSIEGQERCRIVPKQGNLFHFTYEGREVVIDGSTIRFRPEDRIKRIR